MPRERKGGLGSSCHKFVYDSDEFRMFYHKVIPCSKHYVHEWTECPFAHPNEKAARRCPRTFFYTGITCPDMNGKQDGNCPRGKDCLFAHNLFEFWLHPSRYRTQMCSFGGNCRRSVCFFAHNPAEVRKPDSSWASSGAAARETPAPTAGVEAPASQYVAAVGPVAKVPTQVQATAAPWPVPDLVSSIPTPAVVAAAATSDPLASAVSPEAVSLLLASLLTKPTAAPLTTAPQVMTSCAIPVQLCPPVCAPLHTPEVAASAAQLLGWPAIAPQDHLAPLIPLQVYDAAGAVVGALPVPPQLAAAVMPVSQAPLVVSSIAGPLTNPVLPADQQLVLQALLSKVPAAYIPDRAAPAVVSPVIGGPFLAPYHPAVLPYLSGPVAMDHNAVLQEVGLCHMPVPQWPLCYSR